MSHLRRCGTATAALTAALALAVAPAGAQDPPIGKKHAVVIGVNGTSSPFSGVPTLRFAGEDASELSDMLSASGWDVAPIGPREATRAAIVRELTRLAYDAKEQDTVLVYFAGHGVRDPGPAQQTYWLTYHASPTDLAVEGLRLSHLLEYVAEIPATRKLVILDHCYSGDVDGLESLLGSDARDASATTRMVRKAFPLDEFTLEVEARVARGLVIFGSAREEAYEFSDLGHGVFTYVLLEALREAATDLDRNGRVSIGELSAQISSRLATLASDKGISQVAIEVVRGSGLTSWEPFDVKVGASDLLKGFVTDLDVSVPLDPMVKIRCLQAIQAWDEARRQGVEPSRNDQRIVDEINGLRDLGDSVSAADKRESLQLKVRALM